MSSARESVLSATLEKWTNFWSGWQKRYCVISTDGRLSIYLDEDNMSSVGSRGHLELAAAHIAPEPDLSCFRVTVAATIVYFRAANHRERQRWILALTSAKIRAKQRDDRRLVQPSAKSPEPKRNDRSGVVKPIARSPVRSSGSTPRWHASVHKAISAALLLEPVVRDQEAYAILLAELRVLESHIENHSSPQSSSPADTSSYPSMATDDEETISSLPSTASLAPPLTAASRGRSSVTSVASMQTVIIKSDAPSRQSPRSITPDDRIKSFFTAMPEAFNQYDYKTQGIPTKKFLDSCRSILPCVERLGSTTFAPVKSDVLGNITKVEAVYDRDPSQFHSLQRLLQDEIARNATKKSKSATDALMWLRRALRFLCALLMDIAAGNKNVANAATKAYGATLAKHHNFVVRGIFNLAMQSVPNYSTFIATLGPASEDIILQDMQAYSAALEAQLDVLDVFYTKHDIEV